MYSTVAVFSFVALAAALLLPADVVIPAVDVSFPPGAGAAFVFIVDSDAFVALSDAVAPSRNSYILSIYVTPSPSMSFLPFSQSKSPPRRTRRARLASESGLGDSSALRHPHSWTQRRRQRTRTRDSRTRRGRKRREEEKEIT